jgi:hypothetical protein
MTRHTVKPKNPHKATPVETTACEPVAHEGERGTRIVVLTGDPTKRVEIFPGCRIDSLCQEKNSYFLEDGNALVGMVVDGGTVEYRAEDRTYVVRLTDGRHTAE